MKTAVVLSTLAAVALAAPAQSQPERRDGPGCADASFKTPEWTVDLTYSASYIFTTPAHQNSGGTVSFNLSNSAIPGEVAACSAYSTQLSDFFYGTMWYKCRAPSSTIDFTYNRPTGELQLKQSWVCSDREPEWPIIFFAAGNHTDVLTCNTEVYQNQNWTIGDIYSSRTVTCDPVSFKFSPTEISAIAK